MVLRRTTDDTTANINAMMGLSGLDTASMLKQMMKPYKTPITLASQKQQLVIWRQERYRESISRIREFASKFLDFMSPATNMLSTGTFRKFNIENDGSEYVKITTTGTTKAKAEAIEIERMPTFSSVQGRSGITSQMVGTNAPDWAGAAAAGESLSINMDGIVRHVAITSSIDSAAKLQEALDSTFGYGKIIVEEQSPGGELVFTAGAGVNQITIYDGTNASARYDLGFGSSANTSNRVTLDTTLVTLSGRLETDIKFKSVPTGANDSSGSPIMHDVVQFSINGKSFEFDSMVSLRTVIDTVNGDPSVGAKIRYDNGKDAFTVTATVGGPGNTVSIVEQETSLFGAIGLTAISSDRAAPSPPDQMDLFCGYVDGTILGTVNDAINDKKPLSFVINVDGSARIITLDNGSDPTQMYLGVVDLLAGFNAKLSAAFPDAHITAAADTDPSTPGRYLLFLEIDRTPPAGDDAPTWASSVSVGAPPGMSAEDAEDLLAALGLDALPRYTEGEYGKVTIDGVMLQVDRTAFEYNGVGYELLKETPAGTSARYSIAVDADSIVSVVREFVDAYNEIIAMVEGALREEKSKDYKPLSDEQRADMKDTEIEKWEEKARLGLLRGDTNYISLSTKLRQCLFGSVLKEYGGTETVGVNFESIGIFTRSYEENGALHLDETKLRAALDKDLDAVAQLFAKAAQVPAYDEDQSSSWNTRQQRLYQDRTAGIAVRLSAIIDDFTRTTRDAYGNKGILVERAGVLDDMSSTNNAFSREILQYDVKITTLWERYDKIEKNNIKTLSRLETFMQTKNIESMWITQQFNAYQS